MIHGAMVRYVAVSTLSVNKHLPLGRNYYSEGQKFPLISQLANLNMRRVSGELCIP